jgi:serine/threonine protein kinase
LSVESHITVTNDNLTVLLDVGLGSGEFGNIFLGVVKTPRANDLVAVKTLNEENKINRNDFLREAAIMAALRHVCIVNIFGVLENPELMVVQEYMNKGDLLEYLKSNSGKITECNRIQWVSQIACGMKYLESQKFVSIASDNQ